MKILLQSMACMMTRPTRSFGSGICIYTVIARQRVRHWKEALSVQECNRSQLRYSEYRLAISIFLQYLASRLSARCLPSLPFAIRLTAVLDFFLSAPGFSRRAI